MTGCLQASRARLTAAVQQSMQHSIHHWAVAQVCDWVDYIGLGQYRKKFVHHCIDGRLLLSLTHKDLKVRHTLTAPPPPPPPTPPPARLPPALCNQLGLPSAGMQSTHVLIAWDDSALATGCL